MKLASQAIQDNSEKVLALNREQLYEGKTSEGTDISPTYLDDPYFKTREAAQRYSDWKDEITPNSKRKKGVPNLYIDGTLHNSIEVRVDEKGLKFNIGFHAKNDVKAKFGENITGLDKEKRIELMKQVIPSFQQKIRSFLKL